MYDFFFSSGTGHSLMLLMFVIGLGLILDKYVKIKGVTLGPIWVLFVGILFSALGAKADSLFLHFIKEFGLILYVYLIGFQVGPGFFSSFHKDGLKFNLLSLMMVVLVVLMTIGLWQISSVDLPSMVGSMSGAVTNTPGMGTAQQTWYDSEFGSFLSEVDYPATASEIANSFAIVYPIGLLLAILIIGVLRRLFRVDPLAEAHDLEEDQSDGSRVFSLSYEVVNPAIVGKNLSEVLARFSGDFRVTGVARSGKFFSPTDDPVLEAGDCVHVDLTSRDRSLMRLCFGNEVAAAAEDDDAAEGNVVTRKLMVTRSSITGRKLYSLDLEKKYGVSVVRVLRSGMELVARPEMYLQMGDGLRVVGTEEGIASVGKLVGNKSSDLDKPNLIPVFIGIGLGLILGAVPIHVGGVPYAVHFGLAGGPMILGIIIGHFGPRWRVTTYTSTSALRMVREIALYLLLATVGLGAGPAFAGLFARCGLQLLLFGTLIALVPMVLTGLFARYVMHLNFFNICGLLSGSSTNPIALEFVRRHYGTDAMTTAYAAVYPFALFLQVLAAQLLILLAV